MFDSATPSLREESKKEEEFAIILTSLTFAAGNALIMAPAFDL